jgi:hypothetical protein
MNELRWWAYSAYRKQTMYALETICEQWLFKAQPMNTLYDKGKQMVRIVWRVNVNDLQANWGDGKSRMNSNNIHRTLSFFFTDWVEEECTGKRQNHIRSKSKVILLHFMHMPFFKTDSIQSNVHSCISSNRLPVLVMFLQCYKWSMLKYVIITKVVAQKKKSQKNCHDTLR